MNIQEIKNLENYIHDFVKFSLSFKVIRAIFGISLTFLYCEYRSGHCER